jgi:hypothetical protein
MHWNRTTTDSDIRGCVGALLLPAAVARGSAKVAMRRIVDTLLELAPSLQAARYQCAIFHTQHKYALASASEANSRLGEARRDDDSLDTE